jgi:hypothetical protein
MDAVLRATVVYFFLLLVFRIAGRRMLSETTTFDLVLLLIVAEATQQVLLGNDSSVTNAFLVIITLIGMEIALTALKQRSAGIAKWIDGVPSIIIEDGRPLKVGWRRRGSASRTSCRPREQGTDWNGWTRSNTQFWNATAASRSSQSRAADKPARISVKMRQR